MAVSLSARPPARKTSYLLVLRPFRSISRRIDVILWF